MKKIFKTEYASIRLNEKFMQPIWFEHNESIEAESPFEAAKVLNTHLKEQPIDDNVYPYKLFFRVMDENEEIYLFQSNDFE